MFKKIRRIGHEAGRMTSVVAFLALGADRQFKYAAKPGNCARMASATVFAMDIAPVISKWV